ncbi:MAG: PepSY domain-containing protein [Acidimicrobiales bacterium]
MSRPTWLTAAGIGGAIVIAGSALVAVAATGPSPDPGTTSSSPSATSSAEGTPESGASVTPSPSSTPESGQPAVTAAEAVEIARAELAAGGDVPAVEEIDLELEDGRQIWDIEFVGDHEVEVDSTTGDVVKLEFGDGRDDDDGHDDDGHDDDGHRDSGHGRGGHDDGPNHD